MKQENKKLIKEFLKHTDSMEEDILEDSKKFFGCIPPILRIMQERSEFFVFSSLKDFFALRPKSLDEKTVELITIAAASCAGADKCLKVHMNAARRAGASQDEILDTIFIAGVIGQTRVLASSLRTYHEIFEGSSIEEPFDNEN
ncbi:MAG: carboxymuconolactone decarboxylase family protein [Methanotrichaceae archaeon]